MWVLKFFPISGFLHVKKTKKKQRKDKKVTKKMGKSYLMWWCTNSITPPKPVYIGKVYKGSRHATANTTVSNQHKLVPCPEMST